MRVVFSARALRQLADLNFYISEAASDSVADAYTERILRFCSGLDTFPNRGTCRDDIMPGLRVVGFERRGYDRFLGHGRDGLGRGDFLRRARLAGRVEIAVTDPFHPTVSTADSSGFTLSVWNTTQ